MTTITINASMAQPTTTPTIRPVDDEEPEVFDVLELVDVTPTRSGWLARNMSRKLLSWLMPLRRANTRGTSDAGMLICTTTSRAGGPVMSLAD